MAKIRLPLQEITKNCKQAMIPFENLAIDENLVLWKGRLSFKQFIKTKRHTFDTKIYVINDCKIDFILDILIYTGSTTNYKKTNPNLGISGAVVNTLIKPYLNRGHKLFVENWYSSPSLVKYLHKKKTNVTGIVRKNRKGMPSMTIKLKTGQTESHHTNIMLAVKWKDRRDVIMLTTQYEDKMISSRKQT